MSKIIVALSLVASLFASASALAQESITLVPYSSESFGIETVIPEGWTDVGGGLVARQNEDTDPTLIAQQSAPLPAAEFLTALLPQLDLDEAPESVGTHRGGALEWTLYEVTVPVGGEPIAVDLALADGDGVSYLVLVQTSPDEAEALHDSIFLPTLDVFAPLQEDDEPVPYDVEDVTFENGDVTLAGTLTLPPRGGPHPVIVLVSGSGPQNRDESLGGGITIRPFRLLADALTREGVAVLRYDDRGTGKSTGTFSDATVPDFATDAEAAIRYLGTREEIDPARIGLLGHSEGGLVAAMLGARNEDLDFIIALAGPGVIGSEVLELQYQRIAEAEGATPDQVAAQRAFVQELLTIVDDPAAVEELTFETTLEQVRALPEEQQAALGDVEEYARLIAEQSAQQLDAGWFRSFLAYDPGPDWEKTAVPVLAIFGGKDVQVDAEQNAPALEAALEQGGNEDYEIVVLEDANHLFQEADTGSFSEYATLPAEFTADLLPTIIDWLESQGIVD